jgi:hypothetical protein
VDGASEFGGFEDTTLLRRDIGLRGTELGSNLNQPRVSWARGTWDAWFFIRSGASGNGESGHEHRAHKLIKRFGGAAKGVLHRSEQPLLILSFGALSLMDAEAFKLPVELSITAERQAANSFGSGSHLDEHEQLNGTPEPPWERLSGEDHQLPAAGQVHWQACERLAHIGLVDTRPIEPAHGHTPSIGAFCYAFVAQGGDPTRESVKLAVWVVVPRVADEPIDFAQSSWDSLRRQASAYRWASTDGYWIRNRRGVKRLA